MSEDAASDAAPDSATVSENPAVDELKDLLIQIVIMQARQYDLLLALVRNTNAEDADKLVQYHSKGGLLCPVVVVDPNIS